MRFAQAHWPAAPRLVTSDKPRLINLPLTTIHLTTHGLYQESPIISHHSPVEQDEARQDGDDAQGGDGGDREDDGEVDNDHHGANHKPDDREHVDNQPGNEVVSVLIRCVK